MIMGSSTYRSSVNVIICAKISIIMFRHKQKLRLKRSRSKLCKGYPAFSPLFV